MILNWTSEISTLLKFLKGFQEKKSLCSSALSRVFYLLLDQSGCLAHPGMVICIKLTISSGKDILSLINIVINMFPTNIFINSTKVLLMCSISQSFESSITTCVRNGDNIALLGKLKDVEISLTYGQSIYKYLHVGVYY